MQQCISRSLRTPLHPLRSFQTTRSLRRTHLYAQSHFEEAPTSQTRKSQVLDALSTIIDPDLDENIVDAGFIKDLKISENQVSFTVELTTPACPIKAEFERQCLERVQQLDWVDNVDVKMTANSASTSTERPGGLKNVSHILGVYSCKGGQSMN